MKFIFSKLWKFYYNCTYTFFNKQLGSGLSPQSYFYFKGFQGSKLFNGSLIIWPSNLCEEYNNFLDSKSILLIDDFKIFPTVLLRQLDFGALSVYQLFCVYYKGKTPLSFNLYFLLLISEIPCIEFLTTISNIILEHANRNFSLWKIKEFYN